MKTVLFEEKLHAALDFAKKSHAICSFASVLNGVLRYVFFVKPVKVSSIGSDDVFQYEVCLNTNIVVSRYNVSNAFDKDETLIPIQTAIIPLSQASSVYDFLYNLSNALVYED